MNRITTSKIKELEEITRSEKIILVQGGNGVGKTFLAKEVAKGICKEGCYKVISLHKGFDYTDFVQGISIKLSKKTNSLEFKEEIKVLKSMLDEADKNSEKEYVLILDDVQRTNIYSLFENELDEIIRKKRDNFFLIATMNTAVTSDELFDYSLFGKFRIVEVESDYKYIQLDQKIYYDFAEFIYNKTNAIVRNYLNYSQSNWRQQFNRYKIGHGYFKDFLPVRIRYQIVPLLREYIKDGILIDRDGTLENELLSLYYESSDSIQLVNPSTMRQSDINLNCNDLTKNVKRLHDHLRKVHENGFLSDNDFFSCTLINERVFKRVSDKPSIPYSGSLFVNEFRNDKFHRFTDREKSTDGVPYYSNKLHMSYRGKKYYYSVNAHYKNKDASKTMIPKTVDECSAELNYQNIWGPILYEYLGRWLYLIDTFGNPAESINVQQIIKYFSNAKTLEDLQDCLDNITKTQNLNKGVIRKMKNHNIIEIMEQTGIHQIILQGPPGTSKTYTAKRELENLLESKKLGGNYTIGDLQVKDFRKIGEDQLKKIKNAKMCWSIVQFHPTYSYEDFVRGITVTTKDGQPHYDTINKILGKIAKFADAEPDKDKVEEIKCFLIIDEINRANVANVFGELIYALEYRNESVSTPYSIESKTSDHKMEDTDIKIPDNVYIIGTMNTADKSIGTLDYAIRRRFIFYPCLPKKSIIKEYYSESEYQGVKKSAVNLFNAVEGIFDAEQGYLNFDYNTNDVQVGHTYFLAEKNGDEEEVKGKLFKKFEYQVLPLLKEYYKDGVLEYDTADNKQTEATLIMKYLGGGLTIGELGQKSNEATDKTMEQALIEYLAGGGMNGNN